MEKYTVLIEMETIQINVSAKNKSEAKKKAIQKLDRKKASKYIDHDFMGSKGKKISVEKW